MSSILGTEYLTVEEAAKALKVSTSTIWRWIDQGHLPAYRVGQRKIRLKASEIAQLITPARSATEKRGATAGLQQEIDRLSRPLNDKEKKRALAALEAVEQLDNDLDPLAEEQISIDSTDLLKQSREERSQQQA